MRLHVEREVLARQMPRALALDLARRAVQQGEADRGQGSQQFPDEKLGWHVVAN